MTLYQFADLPAWISRDVQEYIDANRSVEAWPLSREKIFEYYCEWNGICNWASRLSSVLDALHKLETQAELNYANKVTSNTNIDYSKSKTPKFDAVEDVIRFFGLVRWNEIARIIRLDVEMLRNREKWTRFTNNCGVFNRTQIIAWYEHIYGGGTWKESVK